MLKYVIRRFLQLIPILFGITFLSFILIHSVSGDAVDMLYENVGGELSEQAKQKYREELGLDKSIIIQYINWLKNFLKGDMGISYISKVDVFKTFMSKLPNTIYLTISSTILTVVISIPIGILAAINHNHIFDYMIRFFSFIGNSLPNFFVSLLLILFFCVKLKWFSVIGNSDIKSIILPTITLTISMSSKYIRQIRIAVLEELNKDYVTAAKARGIHNSIILYKSVLKVIMITIVTLLTLSIGSLLGGAAIVESIFMWDGVGKLAVDSITMRDYPMIQLYIVWLSIIYVTINLISDIIYHILDPRVDFE